MRRWIVRIACGFLAVFIALASLVFYRNSVSRKSLEKYEASLRAKGEKLTWAEMDFHFTTNAEELQFQREYSAIEMEPNHHPLLMAWVAPGAARVSWQQETNWELDDHGEDKFTNLVTWEALQKDWDDSASALAAFKQILQHPSPDGGPHTNTPVFIDNFFDWQMLSRATWELQASIVLDLHHGRTKDLLADMDALASVAMVHKNEPGAYGLRTGQVLRALSATWEILQATNLDETTLAHLQAKWEGVDFTTCPLEYALRQRESAVDTVNYLKSANTHQRTELMFPVGADWKEAFIAHHILMPAYMLFELYDDNFFLLRYRQSQVELLRQFPAQASWLTVQSALQKLHQEQYDWLKANEGYRYWLSLRGIMFDPTRNLYPNLIKRETERRLAVVAIALQRYHLSHGQWPSSLTALVPEQLSAVPPDPMTSQSLLYHLQTDGTYVLYSAGTDGQDDGGDPTPVNPTDPPGLWTGRDAVWPHAATPAQIAVAEAAIIARAAASADQGDN
jgi:hypothetical protein